MSGSAGMGVNGQSAFTGGICGIYGIGNVTTERSTRHFFILSHITVGVRPTNKVSADYARGFPDHAQLQSKVSYFGSTRSEWTLSSSSRIITGISLPGCTLMSTTVLVTRVSSPFGICD